MHKTSICPQQPVHRLGIICLLSVWGVYYVHKIGSVNWKLLIKITKVIHCKSLKFWINYLKSTFVIYADLQYVCH
jgi:hypothetical protein